MCKVMEVSTSGYYKWAKSIPSAQKQRRTMLVQQIKNVHLKSRCTYGSPRITQELRSNSIRVSQPLVAKLMRENNIRSVVKKKFKATTDSSHGYAVVENKLMRNFAVRRQNQVWVSDITYIETKEGWAYLTVVIDLFDRKVIGWSLSKRMYASQTSIPALRMALLNRPLDPMRPLLFHSDRGIQYACTEFVKVIARSKNIERSMSRKGNCWDNAVAESFFKSLKVECVYQNRYDSRQSADLSVFEYIEGWYNTNRRHKHLNNQTIKEFNQSINNLKNAA